MALSSKVDESERIIRRVLMWARKLLAGKGRFCLVESEDSTRLGRYLAAGIGFPSSANLRQVFG